MGKTSKSLNAFVNIRYKGESQTGLMHRTTNWQMRGDKNDDTYLQDVVHKIGDWEGENPDIMYQV